MSSTFSDLVADALEEHCSRANSSEKYLLGAHLGASTTELYASLAARTNAEVEIGGEDGQPHVAVRAVRLDNGVLVVPYLVTSAASPSDPNRGNQYFTGRLRDFFDRGDAGVRILVTFDDDPIETETSAMDMSLPETVLAPERLLERIDAEISATARTEVATLLGKVAEFVHGLGTVSGKDIGQLLQFARSASSLETNAEVGEQLGQLPWLLSDPNIDPASAWRLGDAWTVHRNPVDGWAADPESDFEQHVREQYDEETAAELIASRSLGRVQWEKFTYPQLEAALRAPTRGGKKRNGLDPLQAVAFDTPISDVRRTETSSLYTACVLVPQGPLGITVTLKRELMERETLHLLTYTEEGGTFTRATAAQHTHTAAGSRQLRLELDPSRVNGDWMFCEIVLTNGTTYRTQYLGKIDLAVLLRDDIDVLPVESQRMLEVSSQRFLAADEPVAELVHSDGSITDADSTERIEDPDVAGLEEMRVTIGASTVAVPVLVQLPTDEPPAETAGEASPEHAVLHFAATEQVPLDEVEVSPPSFVRGRVHVSIGGQDYVLADVPDLPRSRWVVEAEILANPETTHLAIAEDGALTQDQRLESLSLEGYEDEFGRFMTSRKAFFDAVLRESPNSQVPTVLAVPLAEMEEAIGYVGAYKDLLESVPDGADYAREFERLLFIDSIALPDGNVLVGPTSPLAVAAHQELQELLSVWRDQGSGSLLPKDVDLLNSRFALPLVEVNGNWYEPRFVPYPWRLYGPREIGEEGEPEPFLADFIVRRIEAFLDVHPVYKDERRTLTLAFVNPGAGKHIVDGLKALVKRADKSKSLPLELLPRFEIQLYSATEEPAGYTAARLGIALDDFMTATSESGEPVWLDQELIRRMTYTKAEISQWVKNPNAFAHLAFIQDYFRPSREQLYSTADGSATTYVNGLAVDLERAATVQPNDVVFSSGVWLPPPAERSRIEELIARSLEIAAAAAANTVARDQSYGVVTRVAKSDIPELYDHAAWVVHLDRHIGLELFSPQNAAGGSPAFILDHTDQENLEESGFDAITATAMVDPYLARIESIFEPLLDTMEGERAADMLRWLNVLSGRWALRLLQGSQTQIKERLATVIAFRFLANREQIYAESGAVSAVISLDELLRVTPKEGLALSEGWAAAFDLKGGGSDDLLLLRVPLVQHARPTVYARVIEVKYSEGVPPVDTAAAQVAKTHGLLQAMFGTGGAGQPFRARMLAKIIKSYVSRLTAYGYLPESAAEDPAYIGTLNRIARGDFDFEPGFSRDRDQLIGDFVSVEPTRPEPLHQPLPHESSTGAKVGWIRIGKPLVEALLAGQELETLAGDYAPPVYEEASSDEGIPSPTKPADAEPEAAGPEAAEPEAPEPQAREPEQEAQPEEATDEIPVTPSDGEASGEAPAEPPAAEAGTPTEDGTSTGGILSFAERFEISDDEKRNLADQLDVVFARYHLPVQSFDPALASAGPNAIRFRARMLHGGTISALEARSRDIQRELGVEGQIFIGQEPQFVIVEVPRPERITIGFADVEAALASPARPGSLPFVLGVDSSGDVQLADLADLPHLLVAGTTGSGKSVFLTSIAASLALLPPGRLELVVIDIKGLDFPPLAALPHLGSREPIDDPERAAELLGSLISDEVDRRKAKFRASGARQISEYYERVPEAEWLPQIVVMIDEYAQLVARSGLRRNQLEDLIQQYAQVARAYGIYLVLATQRPSVDVLTGRIKGNLPSRAVFQLPSFNDSRTVIDTGGAEKLLGAGDMLFYRDGSLDRFQTVLTSPEDVVRLAARWR